MADDFTGKAVIGVCPRADTTAGPRLREAQHGLGVYGLPVAPHGIVSRQSYNDAYAVGLGVTEYEPHGKAAQEVLTCGNGWIGRWEK